MKRWQRALAGGMLWVLLGALWLMQPPQWPGPESVPIPPKGLKRSCDIAWDEHQIPHIRAHSTEAAFYCWGRVHAKDRGWQMDYLRRMALGRTAEWYGGQARIIQDFSMRLLDIRGLAARWEALLKRKQKRHHRWLSYYIWGVNDGFVLHRKQAKKHYAYRKYGFHRPAWTLRDTLAIVALQSLDMTRMAFANDLKHARFRLHLGDKRYRQLFGPDKGLGPLDRSIIEPGEHPLAPHRLGHKASSRPKAPRLASKRHRKPPPSAPAALRRKKAQALGILTQLFPFLRAPEAGAMGSNSWVVAPARSTKKVALLANDTHMSIFTPNIWYELHVQSPHFNATGFSIPGMPAIIVGHNRDLAWGMTAGQSNTADVMAIQPDGEGFFRLGAKRYQLHTVRPIVWMRAGPFHLPVFWRSFQRSRIGPVLPLPWPEPNKRILMRWVGYHVKSVPLHLIDLMFARSVQQADAHLRRMELPNLSAVLADRKGNIGFRQFGLVARRKAGIHGFLRPERPQERWQGFLKPSEMPALLNPKRGFVVTANNHPFPDTYPFFLGHAFGSGLRASRIAKLLTKQPRLSLADIQKIQGDRRVPLADFVLPRLLRALSGAPLSALEKRALKQLKNWDRQASRKAVAPSIFRVWVETLREQLFYFDRIPQGKGYHYPYILGLKRALDGSIPVYTRKPLKQEIRSAFRRALALLATHLKSDDLKTWTWGRCHRIHFSSWLGRSSKFHPKPQPMGGDTHTVNVGHHTRGRLPYRNLFAASVRLLVELGPQIRSFSAMSGGQRDANPTRLTAEHKRWLNNQYRRRWFTPAEIQKHTKKRQTIHFQNPR